jgi:hypothetical protein
MAFTAGQKVRASALNMTPTETRLTASLSSLATTTYTAVTDGTNTCGHSFTAPPSGKVEFSWSNSVASGTTGSTVFVGVEVRQGSTVGSGTVQSAVSDNEAFQVSSASRCPGSDSRVLTGLTAGSVYNVRQMWRNSGSTTSTGAKPRVTTKPLLA